MASSTDLKTYKLNHSMIRVKDPKKSIPFYEFLGMSVLDKRPTPAAKYDLYFLGYNSPGAVSHGKSVRDREGIIELTHNYGTEDDAGYRVNNGNEDPNKGFGHVCISVDNMQAACDRLERAGYRFQKKYTEGNARDVAFVLDPDGYWVEIVAQNALDETEGVTETDVTKYRMNRTMLRIKDQDRSLRFYQDVLGLTLTRTMPIDAANSTHYFLAYTQGKPAPENSGSGAHPNLLREGIVELQWVHGTEKDDTFKYHNGNDEPQGFGHICISVDNINAACQRFEELGVRWKKRLTDGRMKEIAFLLDPDDYWVEVIQSS